MIENPPLKIDLRLVLETVADGLAVLVVGIAALDLGDPWRVGLPLIVTVLLVMTRRLLGQKTNAALSNLGSQRDQLTVQNTVLTASAAPATKQAAEEAAAAIRPGASIVISKEEGKQP